MKTLLVTGGAGFIGSNFVRYLLRTYPDVRIINLDKLTYAGRIENIEEHDTDNRHEFVKGDIANKELVEHLCRYFKVDAIVNFAAESHVDRSIHFGSEFVQANIEGPRVLLELTRDLKLERMLQVSTDEVYGDIEPGSFSTEEDPLVPSSVYSATKAGAEMLCMAFSRTYGTPIVTTRCTNNYGPYQFPEKIVPLFITNLLAGKNVPVYGDGGQIRDWIYVEDHCRGIDSALRKGRSGHVYSFAARNEPEITNMHLTKTILDLLGLDDSRIDYVVDRAGHDRRYAVKGEKARTELGWKPSVTFREGMERTVNWYKENESWWKPLQSSRELNTFFEVNYKAVPQKGSEKPKVEEVSRKVEQR